LFTFGPKVIESTYDPTKIASQPSPTEEIGAFHTTPPVNWLLLNALQPTLVMVSGTIRLVNFVEAKEFPLIVITLFKSTLVRPVLLNALYPILVI